MTRVSRPTRDHRKSGLDLDHAVARVRDRTNAWYAAFLPEVDPRIAEKFDRIRGTASNVAGIMHWLDRAENPAA